MTSLSPSKVERRSLGEVCTLQRGFDLPVKERKPGNYPLVTSSGPTDFHSEARVRGPGVVTGRSGSIGNVFYVEDSFWPLNTALYVKDFHGNDPRYIFYLLQFFDLGRFASGAGVPTLNRNHVHDEAVWIAIDPDEQKRIVAVLDQAFAALDRARALADANLADTEELYRNSVDRLLDDRRGNWIVGTFADVVGPVYTGPFGSMLHERDYVENEIPLVNPANIIGDRIVANTSKTVSQSAIKRLSSYRLKAGDLVIGRRGEMGRCATVTSEQDGWICGTGSFFVRPKQGISAELAAHILRTPTVVDQLTSIASGTTMLNLGNKAIGNMAFAMPPRDQQSQLLGLIEKLRNLTDIAGQQYAKELKDLSQLRRSLLQKAFAGELT